MVYSFFVKYTVKNKWAINFENVRIMCLSWMKCQYAHCCFIDLINYNWRCCSSTRQTPSSHQSVTRDEMADIIAHLVLIANTHCMSWLPWNDAISLKTLYFANQGSYYQPGLILPTRAHITNQGSYYQPGLILPDFTSFEVDREIIFLTLKIFKKKQTLPKIVKKILWSTQ
jgi:hypothetical protein